MAGDGDRDPGGWWPEDEAKDGDERRRDEPKRKVPRGLSSPDRPRPSGRYSMFVGLAFVALIVVALLNLLAVEQLLEFAVKRGCSAAGVIGIAHGPSFSC